MPCVSSTEGTLIHGQSKKTGVCINLLMYFMVHYVTFVLALGHFVVIDLIVFGFFVLN